MMLRLFLPAYPQAAKPIAPALSADNRLVSRALARFTGDLFRSLAATAHVRHEATVDQPHQPPR